MILYYYLYATPVRVEGWSLLTWRIPEGRPVQRREMSRAREYDIERLLKKDVGVRIRHCALRFR